MAPHPQCQQQECRHQECQRGSDGSGRVAEPPRRVRLVDLGEDPSRGAAPPADANGHHSHVEAGRGQPIQVGQVLDAVDVVGEESHVGRVAHRLPHVERKGVDADADHAPALVVAAGVVGEPLRRALAQA